MDMNFWMQKAQVAIEKLAPSYIFVLKDLFDGIEWNTLEKGERTTFGKTFKNAVKNGDFPNVIFVGKAQNNSSKYQKV